MEIQNIKEPPEPRLWITPKIASVSISSGQSVPVDFLLHKTAVSGKVSLSVGTLPQGITAAFSGSILVGGTGTEQFTLTVTAALNVTPVVATIQVTASAVNVDDAHASVTMNVKAIGEVQPSYMLIGLIFPPPGSAVGNSSSQVVYGSGSTTGTTDSTSSSFKDDVNVSATLDLGIVNLGLGVEFTASQTNTDSSSVEIDKSTNYQIAVSGPSEDGIDHSYDQFWLWLNPQLNVTIDYQNNVSWELAVAGSQMLIQYVYARWLQDPSQMPAGVAQALADAGIPTTDYPLILACDPFTSGNTAIDPNRFVPATPVTIPYEPTGPNGPVTAVTYTLTSSTTVTNNQETEVQYGVTASVSSNIKAFLDSLLKVSGSLEWTVKSTSTKTTGSSQSASVTIVNPSDEWKGSTDVAVWWDTIFQSFMFAFVTGAPAAAGTLLDNAGNPIRYKTLTLTSGGRRLRTFTNGKGEYRFYGAPQGSGTISDGDHEFPVVVGPSEPRRTLQVTD